MVLEYLKEYYGPGEPIFAGNIDIPNMSAEDLRYHLKKLTDEGKIRRFDAGIYYFPKSGILDQEMPLGVDDVVIHKYINRKGKRVGYYSGHTFANRIGLSTQVPFVEEITSNYAPAPVRKLIIHGRRFIIRRPIVEITDENVLVLQFLDCLKDIEKCAEEESDMCGAILSRYAKENNITKSKIDRFIAGYPLKVYRAIYETGVRFAPEKE